MTEQIYSHRLSNGLIVLGQPLDHVESVSFSVLMPGGTSRVPGGCSGVAAILNNWLLRGAEPYSSRQLVDALDSLGLHRHSSVSSEYLSYAVSLEAGNLSRALELYAEILLRPRLETDQFELCRQLALNELAALDDDPRHKVMLQLYEQYYPEPLGRPSMGKNKDLQELEAHASKHIKNQLFDWSHGIIGIAGKMDFDSVCRQVENLFAEAPSVQRGPLLPTAAVRGYRHIPNDGAQVHIGFMTEVPPFDCASYYQIMAAVSVLSGGMSSRLFTEVREKRGLCYAVGARYHSLRQHAGIAGYAGTTPDKAQQTLDVTLNEFRRLRQGVTIDEMDRSRVGLKSSLIMQNESTSARAARLASDQFLLQRVRPLDEIRDSIEGLSVDSIEEFLAGPLFENFTIVSIGPKELKAPS